MVKHGYLFIQMHLHMYFIFFIYIEYFLEFILQVEGEVDIVGVVRETEKVRYHWVNQTR